MAEDDDVRMEKVDQNETAPATTKQKAFAARRKFLRQALAATSGIALAELLPSSLSNATPQQVQCNVGKAFVPTGEIRSNGTNLQVVMKIINGDRQIPTSIVGTQKQMLRFYSGYNPSNPTQKWPLDNSTAPGPGPTLRCSIGDNVQITFLNQVNVAQFPASMFNGEKGSETGCDEGTTGTDPNWYPRTTGDIFPNCFHASSAANLHFHGTHVTPATTGDNVLINIWPDPKMSEALVQRAFAQIFEHGEMGHIPQKWSDLPVAYRDQQMGPQGGWKNPKIKGLLGRYDATAPYKGGHGLPKDLQLWPVNVKAVDDGEWPQYYVGAYPYCFKIPRYEGPNGSVKMGQAPGTHWYHSHKHGSTAINMFNGLSGAMIIEDNTPTGYDGKLKAFYGNNLQQFVLVFQQITGVTNLLTAGAGAAPVLVNGQFTPTITMMPGQVQMWRLINACVQKALSIQFDSCNKSDAAPKYMQTAQDGVQLSWTNYNLLNKDNDKTPINLAPANRVDLLVQAPNKAGTYVLGTTAAPILFIQVSSSGSMGMGFPKTEGDYPRLPDFLNDIPHGDIHHWRKVVYGWDAYRVGPGRNPSNAKPPLVPNAAPHYTIDNKQFEDGKINQVMCLNTAEEWTIYNETSIAHPFHIHVNPYQIVEIYDPNNADPNKRHMRFDDPPGSGKDFVWWDNFAIPTAKVDSNGAVILNPTTHKAQDPGYFRMRSRFVDFTGQYVQHCHILAHEDRGMMQLLEVVPDKTNLKHH